MLRTTEDVYLVYVQGERYARKVFKEPEDAKKYRDKIQGLLNIEIVVMLVMVYDKTE